MEACGKAYPRFDKSTIEEKLLCMRFHFGIALSSNADEYINLLNHSEMKDQVQ